jgi:hypothetical protein
VVGVALCPSELKCDASLVISHNKFGEHDGGYSGRAADLCDVASISLSIREGLALLGVVFQDISNVGRADSVVGKRICL